jgi:hypothetical protein
VSGETRAPGLVPIDEIRPALRLIVSQISSTVIYEMTSSMISIRQHRLSTVHYTLLTVSFILAGKIFLAFAACILALLVSLSDPSKMKTIPFRNA